MKKEEIWLPVVGFEGLYEVSSVGRVKKVGTNEFILSQRLRAGYPSVNLRKNKKGVDYVVHRLQAIAHIPNPENLPVTNHKDGIKIHNINENLEWTTTKENTIHAYDLGLAKSGQESTVSKLTEADVIEIFRLRSEGVPGKQIAEKFGVYKNAIYHILNGVNWQRFTKNNVKDFNLKTPIKRRPSVSRMVPVIQKDLDGNIVYEFGSLKEASMQTGIPMPSICQAASGQIKTAGGYIWQRKNAALYVKV